MVILALETVTRRGSIALVADGDVRATEGEDRGTHGERLPTLVLDWLRREGRTLRDLDYLAVVSGPGSFTGIRVGMAAIQGFALTSGKTVIPIPTLDAIASGWFDRARGLDRPANVVPCLDGQRGEVFLAAFERTSNGFDESRRVLDPQAARPEDARTELDRLPARPAILVGDGAVRYADVLAAGRSDARVEPLGHPIAEAAARLAVRRIAEAAAPHALRPLYVRRPDAELARARAARERPPAVTIELVVGREDVAAVEALQRRSFSNAWGAESIRWELEHTDVARLYGARDARGTLVGYCACWMVFDELHINSLAVEEAWRRRGVAHRLLGRVIQDAIRAGAKSATLEVRASNVAARALYAGLGFKVEGVRRDYYQAPREDALILWNRRLSRA